jgi:hypothetical protein
MEKVNAIEHNEIFDLAYRFVTETRENIFLTGKAGTGKTTFLKYLKQNCAKNIIVAAPTGVAAINAGGTTLHSLFQLPFQPFLPTPASSRELLSALKVNKQRQQLLCKMELLVIDEISMVRCDVIDAIDTILKSIRRKHDAPFGGVQLLCIGDLFQLPPVAQRHEWNILQEYYASPFFFDSRVIKEDLPLLIELKKIYRQKDDSFVGLLNKVRNNEMSKDDFEDLHQRYLPGYRPSPEEKFITLTSHNNQADIINNRELQKILSPANKYEAIIKEDFPENNYPVEGSLVLKIGAQVMFLKNDVIQKRYFNGKIGVIKSLGDEEIVVASDGADIVVNRETWENTRYVLNRTDGKLEQETLGTFTQFPLRLAWAITIHKSQGLTFEKVMIDAGAAFSSGQVYVALSRCTNLEGIVLLSKIPAEAIYSNENVVKGHRSLTPKGSLQERFAGARQIFTQQVLEEIFSFNEVITILNALDFQIKENSEKLNKEGITWFQNFRDNILSDQGVGLRFIRQTGELMKDEPVIEKNEVLQKRINAAATHFGRIFSSHVQALKNNPLTTEHREVAGAIDVYLNQLFQAIYSSNYFLEYCKKPFSVSSYLQHKIQFSQPRIKISCYDSGRKQSYGDIPNPSLFEALMQWRNTTCEQANLPIYMVANRATLAEISTYLPLNKKDLLQISGFGKIKVDKYGDEVLQMVEEFCWQHQVESNMAAKVPVAGRERKTKSKEEKNDTKTLSYNLFKAGKSVAEIAKERNFTVSTIEGHLAWFVGNGDININEMLSSEKLQIIKSAIKTYGASSLKILKENLPPDISYSEIRLVLASEKAAE